MSRILLPYIVLRLGHQRAMIVVRINKFEQWRNINTFQISVIIKLTSIEGLSSLWLYFKSCLKAFSGAYFQSFYNWYSKILQLVFNASVHKMYILTKKIVLWQMVHEVFLFSLPAFNWETWQYSCLNSTW